MCYKTQYTPQLHQSTQVQQITISANYHLNKIKVTSLQLQFPNINTL